MRIGVDAVRGGGDAYAVQPPDCFGASLGVGQAVSLGIHESQSRLWENIVGRGKAFWTYWFPLAKQVFREPLHGGKSRIALRCIRATHPKLSSNAPDSAR